MRSIKWKYKKFDKELAIFGFDMPFSGWGKRTGISGMYCRNVRYKYYGIKGLFGIRTMIAWGSNWN